MRGLRLVLEDPRHITGIVPGPAGPVPGTTVLALALEQGMASPVITGADDSFELDVGKPVPAAALIVAPPGRCFHRSQLGKVLQGDRAVVRVVQACGGIVMEGMGQNSLCTLLAVEDGAAIPVDIFAMWDQLNGDSLYDGEGVRLFHLAPGRPRSTVRGVRC